MSTVNVYFLKSLHMDSKENNYKTMSKAGDMVPIRPASVVMSLMRAGAAYPNALSFSRNLLRKMCRESWKVETLRLELDAEGRGEALYRIRTGRQTFHFFALSDYFPPSQKIDRAFGINWDVSAAICEGDWTREREARLRVEIPAQYEGRYDSDVLCFCRGNRSERIFDHVVEELAQGRQPDVGLLAGVGYLLRSTAFAGNGLFGMKPFEALWSDHALGGTYDAQMLAAYMLRSFVFDLVEAMAARRGSNSVLMDRRLKRYLGVGNSAGLGLVPFVTNHPLIINQWCLTHERAFAEALARDPDDSNAMVRFLALLERACAYFGAEERDGNGIFADYALLLSDLRTISSALSDPGGKQTRKYSSWNALMEIFVQSGIHPESVELLHGMLLELYPDIIQRYEDRLRVNDRLALEPGMKISKLSAILARDYDWAFDLLDREPCECFWYYPQESPYEPRRGMRGIEPRQESPTSMDVVLMVTRLEEALRQAPPEAPIAEFLAEHPEFVAIVMRVQSLQNAPYAELRMNALSGAFQPFATCRFVLAFYGMEKYDPRLPRSTKGALMQGAPLCDELGANENGDWPFPLPPDLETGKQRTISAPPLRNIEQPDISIKDLVLPARGHDTKENAAGLLPVFAPEHNKLLTRVAYGAGLFCTSAGELADAALLSEALGRSHTRVLLDLLARLSTTPPANNKETASSPVSKATRKGLLNPSLIGADSIDGAGLPGIVVLPRAIDLACARASIAGKGWLRVQNTVPCPLSFAAPITAASRGQIVAVADSSNGKLHLAGPGKVGVWIATVEAIIPAWATAQGANALPPFGPDFDFMRLLLSLEDAEAMENTDLFHIACLPVQEGAEALEDQVFSVLSKLPVDSHYTLTSQALRTIQNHIVTQGVPFNHATLSALQQAALESLLCEEVEKRLATPA